MRFALPFLTRIFLAACHGSTATLSGPCGADPRSGLRCRRCDRLELQGLWWIQLPPEASLLLLRRRQSGQGAISEQGFWEIFTQGKERGRGPIFTDRSGSTSAIDCRTRSNVYKKLRARFKDIWQLVKDHVFARIDELRCKCTCCGMVRQVAQLTGVPPCRFAEDYRYLGHTVRVSRVLGHVLRLEPGPRADAKVCLHCGERFGPHMWPKRHCVA